mgnify:CR=1 FL=1
MYAKLALMLAMSGALAACATRRFCTRHVRDDKGRLRPISGFCPETRSVTRERPVAIDLGAERRKLDQLMEKRDQLQDRTRAQVASCQARYPAG